MGRWDIYNYSFKVYGWNPIWFLVPHQSRPHRNTQLLSGKRMILLLCHHFLMRFLALFILTFTYIIYMSCGILKVYFGMPGCKKSFGRSLFFSSVKLKRQQETAKPKISPVQMWQCDFFFFFISINGQWRTVARRFTPPATGKQVIYHVLCLSVLIHLRPRPSDGVILDFAGNSCGSRAHP